MNTEETSAPTPLGPGDPRVLAGYTVVGRLGEGGQGTVFLARGPGGERVAVKLLHARLSADPKARARFRRETDAARRVGGFCTARVLTADLDGDVPYVISEFIDGPSLRDFVMRRGPQAGAALERLAIGMLTALVTIHRAGIVHRDFKPGNVLVSPGGPRVVDFGIARLLDATSTLTSQAVGTPAYMAPEQLEGHAITPAADMFAWAATVAYAATGNSPFGRDSVAAVVAAILDAEPDLTGLTGRLRPLVVACLAKDPAARPDAARLLADLLAGRPAADAYADNTLRTATRVLTEVSALPYTLPDRPPAPTEGPGPRPSRRLLIGAGSVTLAAALGGVVLLRRLPDDRTRWHRDLHDDAVTSIVAAEDTIFFVLGSGSLYALNAETGTTRWAQRGDLTRLALAGDDLLAAGAGQVRKIDPATGAPRWSTTASTTGKPTTSFVTVPADPDLGGQLVTVGGDLVITAIPETGSSLRVALTALRLSDGRHQWSQTISGPAEKLTMSALAGLSASAKVVAVVVGVTVYGLSTATGKVLWHYRLGENDPGAGVVVGDTVLIGGRNIGQAFHAFDAATGRSRWQAPVEEFNSTSLASDGRTVYVLDSHLPGLHALDVLSGQSRWQRTAIGGSETWGPVGGILYVTTKVDATTLALNATTGKTLWRKDGRAAPTFAATRSTAFVVMSDDKGNKQTINALRTSGA